MIARTYFYMSDRYGLRLSKQDRQLYNAWHKQYPPQTWERQRNHMVGCVMGWAIPMSARWTWRPAATYPRVDADLRRSSP